MAYLRGISSWVIADPPIPFFPSQNQISSNTILCFPNFHGFKWKPSTKHIYLYYLQAKTSFDPAFSNSSVYTLPWKVPPVGLVEKCRTPPRPILIKHHHSLFFQMSQISTIPPVDIPWKDHKTQNSTGPSPFPQQMHQISKFNKEMVTCRHPPYILLLKILKKLKLNEAKISTKNHPEKKKRKKTRFHSKFQKEKNIERKANQEKKITCSTSRSALP